MSLMVFEYWCCFGGIPAGVFREYPKCVPDFKETLIYSPPVAMLKKKFLEEKKKNICESETFVLVRCYRGGTYGINTEISVLVKSFHFWRTNEYIFVKEVSQLLFVSSIYFSLANLVDRKLGHFFARDPAPFSR